VDGANLKTLEASLDKPPNCSVLSVLLHITYPKYQGPSLYRNKERVN